MNPDTLPPRAVTSGFEQERTLRRRHQDGQLIELKNGWALRAYENVVKDGKQRRKRVQKFLGSFEKLPTKRSAQNAMAVELVRINSGTAVQPRTITFNQQAAFWMNACRRRAWKPIKPSVLKSWHGALENHILPVVGSLPLAEVKNRALQTLVEVLATKRLEKTGGRLKAGSIRACIRVFKSVISSAEDADGNVLYPVVWNRRFTPAINPALQKRPTFSTEELNQLVNGTTGRLQMAAVVLASSGLRVGELLGLECKHFDGASLRIEQAAWRGKILTPKTSNAYRNVELHANVAALLKQFVGNRTKGFVFESHVGTPLYTRNFARLLYDNLERLGIPKRGFHAFRRFRNAYLRNRRCPPSVLRYWMGHSIGGMSDLYDQSFTDAAFRRDVCNECGTGFEVPASLSVKRPKPKAQNQSQRPERALMGVEAEAVGALSS